MLYKYLSQKRVDVLQNLSIRFSQTKALNDPFESLPLINLDAQLVDVIDTIKISAEQLWHSLPEHEQTKENEQQLARQLNQSIQDAREAICPAKIGNALMEALVDKIGVLSLSRSFNNLLMWSHYTENHRGYVLGLDEHHPFFHQETYAGGSSSPSKITYTSQRSKTLTNSKFFNDTFLCEKPIDWAYEEEVRIFRLLNSGANISGKDPLGWNICLFDMPADAISCIYIGANASAETKEIIAQEVSANNIEAEIFQMSFSKYRYELEWAASN